MYWSGMSKTAALPQPLTQLSDLFIRIMGAMTRVETGCPEDKVPWDDISHGYELALHNGAKGL